LSLFRNHNHQLSPSSISSSSFVGLAAILTLAFHLDIRFLRKSQLLRRKIIRYPQPCVNVLFQIISENSEFLFAEKIRHVKPGNVGYRSPLVSTPSQSALDHLDSAWFFSLLVIV
jgi:hypothetical protein